MTDTLTPIDAFRDELREFIATHLPPELAHGGKPGHEIEDRWMRALGTRGWAAPAWPVEYGGAGLDDEHIEVMQCEFRRAGAPWANGVEFLLIGPTLLEFGTEDQKKRHLPPIARREARWCQGFSEPGAGSDLASLQMRAERDGDDYVLNGQKIWTSHAQLADWIFCLVRTDPDAKKQAGISFILVPMDQPGVEVAPLPLIDGTAHFTQVFFDNARARVSDLVGPENGGWTIAKHLLQNERGGGDEQPTLLTGPEVNLVDLGREVLGERDGALSDPVLRDRITRFDLDDRAFELTMQRAEDEARAGQTHRRIEMLGKYCFANLSKRRQDLAMSLLGSRGLGWEGDAFSNSELTTTRNWLITRADSIWGGTNEVQLNIIAKRVLEIPES